MKGEEFSAANSVNEFTRSFTDSGVAFSSDERAHLRERERGRRLVMRSLLGPVAYSRGVLGFIGGQEKESDALNLTEDAAAMGPPVARSGRFFFPPNPSPLPPPLSYSFLIRPP